MNKTFTVHLTLVGTAGSRGTQLDDFATQWLDGTGIELSRTESQAQSDPSPGYLTPAQIWTLFVDNRPISPGQWPGHGLILGSEYPGRFEAQIPDLETKPSGELWLVGLDPSQRVRRDFVIYEANEGTSPDLGHELLHVLNVHHEDLVASRKDHLRRHDLLVGGKNHVMPGEDGQRWGQPNPPVHREIHQDDEFIFPLAPGFGGGDSPGILELESEQEDYYWAEPLSLFVTLKPGSDGLPVSFEGPASLSPFSDRLVLYGGASPEELRPLVPPILWEPEAFRQEKLDRPATLRGVGGWIGGPLESGLEPGRSFWLQALYRGIRSSRGTWSQPLEIQITAIPENQTEDLEAQLVFASPELALFVFLGGGPISADKQERLLSIAQGNSRFAKYAAKALGLAAEAL